MEVTLKEICRMQSGATPKSTNSLFYGGNIPWVTISDFKNAQGNIIYKTEQMLTNEGLEAINRRLFKKNTLLLAMYGSVGKTAILGVDAATNQAILGISAKDENTLNIRFLKYWIDFNKDFLHSQGKGAILHNISLTVVQRQKINLPGIETQNKIVAILDKAKIISDHKEETIKKYDELLKSTFVEMFGDPITNNKNWAKDSIQNICMNIVDCPHSTPEYLDTSSEFPCIRTSEIKNGEIIWESMKYISEKNYLERISRLRPEKDDIIFGREGTIGEALLIPSNLKISLGQRVMLLRMNKERINPIFFWAQIVSNGIQFEIKKRTIGATVKRINIKDFIRIKFIIPPFELQNQFSNKIEKTLLLKQKNKIYHNYCQNLLKSLSQQVFSERITIDIDTELEALISAIDLDKMDEDNKVDTVKRDLTFLQRLIDKLQEQDFENSNQYEKAKYIAFRIMKEESNLIKQQFSKVDKKVKLVL